jgi:hypothetical protein
MPSEANVRHAEALLERVAWFRRTGVVLTPAEEEYLYLMQQISCLLLHGGDPAALRVRAEAVWQAMRDGEAPPRETRH